MTTGQRRTAMTIVLAVSAAIVLASCGSGSGGAAEPSVAPPLTAHPAGSVVRVGARPEGIVYDARSKLVAVAVRDPYRLLLLNPVTLAVRRTIRLPGSVRHLQTAQDGRTILVPAQSSRELVQVSVPSGSTTETHVLKNPHDAAETANGDIAVGDEFSGALSIIRDGRVVKTFHDLTQPGGVVADGNLAVVVDVGRYTVTTYDLATLREIATRPAGAGPTHGVLAAHHRVVVADTRGDQVLVYRDAPLRQVGRLRLPGTPYGLAVDPVTDTVWVTLTARNQVVALDLRHDTPTVLARYDTVRQPNTVAVSPGGHTVWITGTDAGVVERIER